MTLVSDARSDHHGIVQWLVGDWKISTEEEARTRSRTAWGAAAWLAVNVVTGLLIHTVSLIGLPLALLMVLQRHETPSRWIVAVLVALMPFLFVVRWANGAAGWTTGVGEFNALLVVFGARCAWAVFALPRARRRVAIDTFT